MKLSSIKGERLLTVIAECASSIENILDDDEVKKLYMDRQKAAEDGLPTVKRIIRLLPVLFGSHAKDLTTILGTIACNTPEGIKDGMTIERYALEGDYLADAHDLLNDKAFIDFLGLK